MQFDHAHLDLEGNKLNSTRNLIMRFWQSITWNSHKALRFHNLQFLLVQILESYIFWDEDDYEYEIFSLLSIAHLWTSII